MNNRLHLGAIWILLIIGNGLGILYWNRLTVWILVITLFHINEFASSALFQHDSRYQRFLVWGNKGSSYYWGIQLITLWEHLHYHRSFHWLDIVGLVISIAGIILRFSSMKTLGPSFSHYINTCLAPGLIINGIYKYLRHPSYLGFYLYVLGVQMFLKNIISMMICIMILSHFFKERIQFEEYFLIKLYGSNYINYKQKVHTWIPFI